MTLGRLATELQVSKSGLYAHFGSKEQLQVATIDAALEIFAREVMVPAGAATPGLRRLEAILAAYFSYLERWVFPGGCFFAALLAEVDATSGSLHEKVIGIERAWQRDLAGQVDTAQQAGEIRADIDAAQLTFELHACMELANYHFVLFRDPAVLERGRRAVARLLAEAATG